jgi:hypothetical protein
LILLSSQLDLLSVAVCRLGGREFLLPVGIVLKVESVLISSNNYTFVFVIFHFNSCFSFLNFFVCFVSSLPQLASN